MKIDSFDNTMICENDEFDTVLSFFKEDRTVPEYIELSILKIVSEKLGIKQCENLHDYLDNLPKDFLSFLISSVNEMYNTDSKINYKNRHLPYLIYYLPANIFKVWKPLLDLQTQDLLKPNVKILDIGTGPGSVPIGIIEYYKSLAVCFTDFEFSLEFTLIEKEPEFMDIANKMITACVDYLPDNLSIIIKNMYCMSVADKFNIEFQDKFDMILMSNFMTYNEGENQTFGYDIISNFKSNMQRDGSFIIIEPAHKQNCIPLKKLRNSIINNKILNIYSPCLGVWDNKENYTCKCFNMVRCYWELPEIYKFLLSKGLYKGKRKDIPFNYIIFRKDNKKKYDVINNQKYFTKLVDLKDYIGNKVNIIAIIRTVIYEKNSNNVNISLCDGSTSCDNEYESVWLKVSTKALNKMGINIPLISAERIKLNGVTVKLINKSISLQVNPSTKIRIEY